MQKKIYPLFLVPCFLALCLVLVFLASCGGGGGGGGGDDESSSSDTGYVPSSVSNNPDISIDNFDVNVNGRGMLVVSGNVELNAKFDPDKPLKISKIEVILASDQNASPAPSTSIKRTLHTATTGLQDYYDLSDWEGLSFSADCELNKFTYNVYVEVYLSDKPVVAARFTKAYKLPTDQKDSKCRSYTLTTSVDPSGSGSVNPSSGTYDGVRTVNLVATPNAGYAFFYWMEGGSVVGSLSNYSPTIDDDITIKAVFVEDKTLSKKEPIKCDVGCIINLGGTQAVKFTGLAFEAQGNASIINTFKTKDGSEGSISTSDISPNGSLSTKDFVLSSTETQSIGFEQINYFAVKINSSTWFLLKSEDSADGLCGTSTKPVCTEVTYWGK